MRQWGGQGQHRKWTLIVGSRARRRAAARTCGGGGVTRLTGFTTVNLGAIVVVIVGSADVATGAV